MKYQQSKRNYITDEVIYRILIITFVHVDEFPLPELHVTTIYYYVIVHRVDTWHKSGGVLRHPDFTARTLAALHSIVKQDWKREMQRELAEQVQLQCYVCACWSVVSILQPFPYIHVHTTISVSSSYNIIISSTRLICTCSCNTGFKPCVAN